jgi:hypothetical protein
MKILSILKFIGTLVITMFCAMLYTPTSSAYPISKPLYEPMAQTAAITLPVGASTSTVMPLNDIGIVALRVSGTCTGLTSAIQITNDVGATKTNWTSVNFWAPPALGTAAGVIDADGSLTSTGFYKIKTDGATQLRLNISALTGTPCIAQMTGSNWDFNGSFF